MLKTPTKRRHRDKANSIAVMPGGGAPTENKQAEFAAPLGLGLAGSALLWAAFPPINLPWLAWVAPVTWLWMVRWPRLGGWRSYMALWLSGVAHWLLMLEGVRLAHPALYAGWIALAAYLGMYLSVFVGLTRVAVHRLRIPIVVAAPVVWVGLELLRGHLITGFSMSLLAHTQAEFPRLIQISDLAGGYLLSFVIMLVAACIARMLGVRSREGEAPAEPERPTSKAQQELRPPIRFCWWPVVPAASAIGATLLYGQWRLSQQQPGLSGPTARVALIQGSRDTVFDNSTEQLREIFAHFQSLTDQAVARHPNLDLIAWPESAFVVGETLVEELARSTSNEEPSKDELQSRQAFFHMVLAGEAARANSHTDSNGRTTQLLVGALTYVYGLGPPRTYNAALLADRSGNVVNRYYKTHPVMFGEYIPFGAALPWLYKITPMAAGLSSGDGPSVFNIAGLKMCPSVCFESTIPHLIRGQLGQLARRGTPADALINVTNDGWFWGTGMLDHHFRCGVFRAVENRKPLLVVANTGISTWVDGSGVIRLRGSRRQPEVLIAEVQADGRSSPYQVVGDLPAWICSLGCMGLAIIGLWRLKPA